MRINLKLVSLHGDFYHLLLFVFRRYQQHRAAVHYKGTGRTTRRANSAAYAHFPVNYRNFPGFTGFYTDGMYMAAINAGSAALA